MRAVVIIKLLPRSVRSWVFTLRMAWPQTTHLYWIICPIHDTFAFYNRKDDQNIEAYHRTSLITARVLWKILAGKDSTYRTSISPSSWISNDRNCYSDWNTLVAYLWSTRRGEKRWCIDTDYHGYQLRSYSLYIDSTSGCVPLVYSGWPCFFRLLNMHYTGLQWCPIASLLCMRRSRVLSRRMGTRKLHSRNCDYSTVSSKNVSAFMESGWVRLSASFNIFWSWFLSFCCSNVTAGGSRRLFLLRWNIPSCWNPYCLQHIQYPARW